MNSNRMIVQLIMPVRKDPESFLKARKAVEYYEGLGFEVYDPHEIAGNIMAKEGYTLRTEAKIQATCLFMLAEANLAVVFPGWKSSDGCMNEINFASSHDIPVYSHESGKRIYFYSGLDAAYQHIADHDTIENMITNGKEVES